MGSSDLQRLAETAASLEHQAGELRAEIERLADDERERAMAQADPDDMASSPGDSEARLVAYSMVLDGKPREEVAQHLADELGVSDSHALLDDLYARAAG